MGDIQAVGAGVNETFKLIRDVILIALAIIAGVYSYQKGYEHGYAKAAQKATYQSQNMDIKNYNGNKISRYGFQIGYLGFGFTWEKKQ